MDVSGMFTVMFVTCMWLAVRKDGLKKVQVVAVIILYVLATASLALELVRLVQGFIYPPDIGRIAFFSDIVEPLSVTNEFIYVIMLTISDMILVWRCWLVWNKSRLVIVLPIMMTVGEAVTGFVAVGMFLGPVQPTYDSVRPWASSMYAISLVANITLTMLIGGRLWWIMRSSSRFIAGGRHGTRDALRLIVESGAAISSAKLIEFVLFQVAFMDNSENMAIYVLYEAMPQIFGIIPTMILLSIQMGVTPLYAYALNPSPTAPNSAFSSPSKFRYPLHPQRIYARKKATESDGPFVSVETEIYKDTDKGVEMVQRIVEGEEV
ncbi:hypothetical protein DACRYDRAFT_107895 [Dacryopinax primogenitus]|uniref:RTA1-domain-containing protein n=1 Tax=Dacryopinax primogenitus (strain DJM 731) TaxID=1858805 RepID=M5GBG3_DACPD|nr:uncharacterized protein DACRYDRAFT_107895 [Dacryopinax primogenitus]EJU01343.1 hypothetical protein DACRYDRAFT_107895 [Dacryopinax primogenitus]